ncbi:MAG: GWxTD domain [Acidobacteriota bacterium]|jgi:GWxTD domain-containing protein|nr:GWxTD domain [Acidobacteriota bacterium]
MRSRGFAFLLLALLAAGCGGGGAPRSAADLTNPFLGPDWSAWLVGPVSRLATPEEVQAFLALKDDAAAEAFAASFWSQRGQPVLKAFEERSAVADRLYSEAGYNGRRTDRGVIYVLYGRPEKVSFDVSPRPGDPPIEVWTYGANSPSGLDGRHPLASYRFIKRGDLTVTYGPGTVRILPPQESPDGN